MLYFAQADTRSALPERLSKRVWQSLQRTLTVLVLVLSGSAFLFALPAAQAAPPPPKQGYPSNTVGATERFGMNDGGVDFVDVMKQTGRVGAVGSGTLTLDANGWPTSDAYYVVFDNRHNMPWNGPDPTAINPDISGTYHLSFTGQATITGGSEDPNAVLIQNQQYDATSNTTTADVVVLPNHWLVVLTFTNTKRLPTDNPGTGFSNVKLIRPSYSPTTKQIFTNETINTYNVGFGPIRTLGLDATNDYQDWSGTSLIPVQWADRVKVSDAYQGGTAAENDNTAPGHQGHGLAWEYIVALANQTHHDLWIHIPAGATDDYVTKLAQLFKYGSDGLNPYTSHQSHPVWAPLNSDLKVYVEYSNEVWNFSFPQYVYNAVAAQNEVTAGGSLLNVDGTTDKSTWAARRYAERLSQIGTLFGSVFGSSSINNKIRPVFLWQYDTEYGAGVFGPGTNTVLDWFNTYIGAPSHYFYGIGEAPYYGPTETSTVDNLFSSMWTASDADRARFIGWQTLASYWGLKQVGYESGPSMGVGTGGIATRDNRMIPSEMHHFLDNWFSVGGDVVEFFTLRGSVSPYGDWLAVEDFSNLNTPKMKGALGVLAAQYPGLTAGYVLPTADGQTTSIDASQYAETGQAPGSSLSFGPQYNDYLLRAAYNGTYTFSLTGSQDSADLQETLSIDGQSIGTVQLPTSAGTSPTVTVNLSAGQHTLRVSYAYTTSGASDKAHPQTINVTLASGGGASVVPSAPGNSSVTAVNDGSLTIQWPTTSDATGYTLYRSTTSGGPYSAVTTVTTNSYTDTGLTDGTRYYYVVTANNDAGSSAYSPQLEGVPTHATKPAAPTGLTVTYSNNQQVTLSWTGNADASGYNIYRSTTSGSGYQKLASQYGNVTIYTDGDQGVFGSNPSNGTTYYYVVTAINSFGESPNSNEVSATPMAVVPPAPTNLSVTASDKEARLQWTVSPGVAPQFSPPQYTVYRATTSGGPYTQVGQTSVDNFMDRDLTNGTTYYYVVTANNSTGSSPYSNEASGTPTGTGTISINAGGPAVGPFATDLDYSGGSTYSTTSSINTTANTTIAAPAAVYKTARYGTFSYTINSLVPGGNYTVRLHFAETYWGKAGQRIFNVTANGALAIANMDIYTQAGGKNRALVMSVPVMADSNGQITLNFAPSIDSPDQNALVSGIEVAGNLSPAVPPGIANW